MVLPTWPLQVGLGQCPDVWERRRWVWGPRSGCAQARHSGAGDPWPPGRGHRWGRPLLGLGAESAWDPLLQHCFPAALRRCCCWGPPRWPASPWTSSSCSSTPSGCAAGGARARSAWTRTAAAPPGASSSPRWSAGERAGRGGAGPGAWSDWAGRRVGGARLGGAGQAESRGGASRPATSRGPVLSQRRYRRGVLWQWGDQ